MNFLGGARTAGAHARWSSLDRGVRLDFNQPYFFAPHFSLGGEGAALVDLHAGLQLDGHRREGDADAPADASARPGRSRSTSEHDSSSIDPDVLDDPTLRDDLIALGLDPDDRQSRTAR